MQSVILTVHLLIIFALIAVVLLQRSEGGGLGIGGGEGGMSGRSKIEPLARLTWYLIAGFIATSLSLTVLASQNNDGGGVLDQLGTELPVNGDTEGDALLPPSLQGDALLPPSENDAPSLPPAAE